MGVVAYPMGSALLHLNKKGAKMKAQFKPRFPFCVVSLGNSMFLKTFLTLIIALLSPSISIAETSSFLCKYSVEASPKGLSKPSSPLELRFIFDESTQKAYLMGNAGSSEVQPIRNAKGLSFIEITLTGNVMVTSITNEGNSVHSRNSIIFEKLIPSQYYGKCVKQ